MQDERHMRTSLTFEEKITVAWAHYVRGIAQQDLAALYNINQGRISEACKAVERTFRDQQKPVVWREEQGN